MKTRAVVLIIAGIFAWVVAAIMGLLLNVDDKFIWTCVTGAALGLIGIRYTVRRDRRSGL